jgi:predicted metalloendopeptidase
MKVRPEFADLMLKIDTHSPEKFRANVPLSDAAGFASAFGCKRDDPMSRSAKERIGIW